MNRALLFGAMMGARTCAPAMEIISDTARSNIPALGYAGTYAIANVLLTLAGTLIIIIWPGTRINLKFACGAKNFRYAQNFFTQGAVITSATAFL